MGAEKTHYHGRYLSLVERDNWEYATRTNAHCVVVLVPVTDDNEIILVEQHRVPVNCRVVELPAGLVGDQDDPNEPAIDAAARELEEETGYSATRLTPLLECPSSSGMSDELLVFFLAEGLERSGPGGGDASEDIEVHRVPLAEVSEWLATRLTSGRMLDPKIYSALFWLERKSRGLEPLPVHG